MNLESENKLGYEEKSKVPFLDLLSIKNQISPKVVMKFWTHDWSIHPEKKHLAFRKGHFLLGQKQIWASSADLFMCRLPSCHFPLHYVKDDDHHWRSREKTRRDLLYITDPGTPLLSTLRLVPHLCQMIKSNNMQGRDKGETKVSLCKRLGRPGWGEWGDVSIYGEGTYLVWIKLLWPTLILLCLTHRKGVLSGKYNVVLPPATVDWPKLVSIPGWANQLCFPGLLIPQPKRA